MVSGDEEVKLLLEAFQMSVSACLSQPSTPVLRAQMLGRLMSVRQSSLLKVPIFHSFSTPLHELVSLFGRGKVSS